jgi:hypothetical protein
MIDPKFSPFAIAAGARVTEGYVTQPNGDSVWVPNAHLDISEMSLDIYTALIIDWVRNEFK